MEIFFWACLLLVFYTYLGYGVVLYALVSLKRLVQGRRPVPDEHAPDAAWPEVSLVVAAYNEEGWIADKIRNHLELDYPTGKLHHVVITDGSNDRTADIARSFGGVEVHHSPERKGKIAAVHRVMPLIKTPIVVFTDANTLLNHEAIRRIVRHYRDPQVGAVAGEKRVHMSESDAAHAAGEGIYWKYESLLKHLDSELYSVVGAAGELFSIRRELYQPVPEDTVIEDFVMTLTIARGGHRVVYEPEAYAVEGPSASVPEELKRKIRIAAGGLQAISRLADLLNPFRYGVLSFQYVSHRVLRWTLTPVALLALLLVNLLLLRTETAHFLPASFYRLVLAAQALFYTLAIIGYVLERRHLKIKAFFIPYYFFVMNYAVFAGFWRNLRGKQTVLWEKAERQS
ncbi:MAG: glycosyltransferase [Bacteroidetes bacterium]|nr:glycosyltransferase [Bacteroidota bacterium]